MIGTDISVYQTIPCRVVDGIDGVTLNRAYALIRRFEANQVTQTMSVYLVYPVALRKVGTDWCLPAWAWAKADDLEEHWAASAR